MYQPTYTTLYQALPISPSTYRRWRLRVLKGEDPVRKPGPKVLKPPDVEKLNDQLGQLIHGSKRSRGVGKLRNAAGDFISRRELSALIANERRSCLREKRRLYRTLHWQVPGVVWSMDIFETRMDKLPEKLFGLCVADLASGYKFPPLTESQMLRGTEISAHLETLFNLFGSPLFIKRDNGGNLNHHIITDLLAQHHVLPLNSPCYYAPYNGAIEHGQGEIKWKLRQQYADAETCAELTRCVELAVHDLNHIKRRRLGGDNSCRRFFNAARFNYSKRKRKEVFVWISKRAFDIVEKAGRKMTPDTAYRIACQSWLVKNGLLSISENEGVLPHSSGKIAHK